MLSNIQAINLKTFSHWLKSPKNRCQITILRTIYSVYYLPIEKMLRITILHLVWRFGPKVKIFLRLGHLQHFKCVCLIKNTHRNLLKTYSTDNFLHINVFFHVRKLHFLLPVSRNSIKHQFQKQGHRQSRILGEQRYFYSLISMRLIYYCDTRAIL